jgi:hypothetical protein
LAQIEKSLKLVKCFLGYLSIQLRKRKVLYLLRKTKMREKKIFKKRREKKKKTKHGRYFYKKILMKYQVDYVFD